MIAGVLAAYPAGRERTKALKACQWWLRGQQGQFVGLNNLACAFVPESLAQVFDGRDNEDQKLATYERALGPLAVEIIPQICHA